MRTRRDFSKTILLAPAILGVRSLQTTIPVAAQESVPGRILYVRSDGVHEWSNGKSSRIFDSDTATCARWSPDATQFLFVKSGPSFSDLVVYNIDAESQIPLTFHQPPYEEGTPEYVAEAAWVTSPDWASNGVIGFMTDYLSPDGTFQVWLIDGPSGTPYLAPASQFEDNIDALSLSSDGSLAAYAVQERQPDGTSLNRSVLRDLTDGVAYPLDESRNTFDPAISPDAQSIAIAVRSKDDMSDILIVDRATGDLTRVTRNLQATNPCWSPDGKWLAFFRMIDFKFEVWVAPLDAGDPGQPTMLFKAADLDTRSGLSWTFAN